MSACKTGCGRPMNEDAYTCYVCSMAWAASLENARGYRWPDPRGAIAFMDFCTRVRLERQNGATP